MLIKPETMLRDILGADPAVEEFFLNQGMHCLSCMASAGETLEQACDVHGLDVDDFVEELNSFINR